MALQSDFRIINFNEHLGDKAGDLNHPGFGFVGNQSSVRNFSIDNSPVGDGYLVIQSYDVENSAHQVRINGMDLPGQDLPGHPGGSRWQTWMERIEPSYLRRGNNTIQIVRRSGDDNFLIGSIVVHWRENA